MNILTTHLRVFLRRQERERYREPVREAIKALLALSWNIEYESMENTSAGREQLHRQDTVSPSVLAWEYSV